MRYQGQAEFFKTLEYEVEMRYNTVFISRTAGLFMMGQQHVLLP